MYNKKKGGRERGEEGGRREGKGMALATSRKVHANWDAY
jgi:hypothetical protein